MRKLLKGIAFLYLFYLGLCLLVVLPVLNVYAPILVRDTLDRELRSELLLFNPFTLAADLRGVSLTEKDGHRPLAFDRVLVDLSLASLWTPGVVFDHLWVRELDVHVLRYEDGDFHFADLLPEEEAADEETGELPGITVQDVQIDAHTLAFTDRTRPGPFRTVQRDLSLRKDNLTTLPDERGEGDLELITDGGGVLRWDGDLVIAAGHSEGRVTLENIDLTPAWRYEAAKLAFEANSARLDTSFVYSARWAGDLQFELSEGSLRLHDVDLVAADPQTYPDTSARLRELDVNGISVDLAASRATVDTVALRGLALSGFDEGDTISLRDIFVPAEGPAAVDEPEALEETLQANESDVDSWRLSLGEFTLDDSHVEWRTPYLLPPVLRVDPLRVRASDINWPAEGPSTLDGALAINDATELRIEGAIDIGSGAGSARATLAGWQLSWLHPLLHEQLRTDLRTGSLALETSLVLAEFAPQTVDLDLRIDDLVTVLHETGEEAFQLAQLAVDGARVDVPGQQVRVAQVRLDRPAGSLHIRENGEINVNGVVREGSGDDGATPADATEAAAGDGGEEESESWRVVLDLVALVDGRLDFADDSLPLPFKTTIENIEAEVRDIDTASETPLTVTLNGNVDGYAPVVIEGSGTPLAERRDGELRFSFRGVDIATMSPYSGTYAGYTIDSGTLTLDLRYALEGQQIDGDNHIVISQMELGEPVESELAVAIPLKLGLALLTDAKGVIDLSVPVSGDVSDPSFSLGKIIGRAVMNVITKAVTAPFKLLAGLVGSDEDLENIAFPAGSADLDDAGRQAVDTLGEALTKRPQLKLRVIGSTDPAVDGPALREAQLRARLESEGLTPEDIETRSDAFRTAVEARYATLTASQTGTAATEGDEGAVQDAAPASLDEQWSELIAQETLRPNTLQNLGNERAAAAKRELVTAIGIDAARVSISFQRDLQTAGVQMAVES